MGLLVVLVIALSSPWLAQQIVYRMEIGRQQAQVEVARKALADFQGTTEAFRLAALSMGASVVHIDTEQLVRGRKLISDEQSIALPRHLLSGQGSGVIIDKSGHIITNYHVIAQASRLTVRLSDGREISDVTVIGADRATDLAVLKIDADNLTPAVWGNSDEMEVGDWVLAVGNPFGLDRTVTQGIISAKSRRGVIGGNIYQDFLQTDAAVNPGNSGGPLVNLAGEIVGINTAIVGEAYQGISFAIPSHMAQDIYEQILKNGSVTRGWLGVAPQDLTPELAQQLGPLARTGAIVESVVPKSPADEAGIEPGDVITEWDGQPVQDAADLTLKVAGTEIDKRVSVNIIRDNQKQSLQVKVGARPTQIEQMREKQ